jgi:NAD(P)-dependent dehydrogenase (short-subunit alcohol dehydrogenase family)
MTAMAANRAQPRRDTREELTEITPIDQQTILITGATDGLGRALAIDLATRGARILVHGRDHDRVRAALADVRRAGPHQPHSGYQADLAALDEVRAVAQEVLSEQPRLHVLVNNAGIGSSVPGGEARLESADGHELRFAVNYLAGFLLTALLKERIVASTPARIVNVSSLGQRPIDFDDVMLTGSYDGIRAYCQSKLAQIMMTIDLAAELEGTGVTVNSLHPATFMPTKMVASPISTLEEGVEATSRLVRDEALDGVTGRFFNGLREAEANPQAYDESARARLRDISSRLTAL